jgi:crotonobetainyl-CoA:carnitine CoA-transferase CaiB-like acyl-CoA transferase
MTMSEQTATRPLSGIRVVDLSRVLAGPMCGQMLADMGADVIKVEAPSGDENRNWAPITASGQSVSYLSVNRGKRGITLDLRNPEGRALLDELLGKADVLIHNFLPGTGKRLGFDPEALLEQFPKLIVCTITAYGVHGPLQDRPGYDGVMQAFSGIMGITGTEDGGPVRTGPSVIDMSTGLIAYGGVMTALFGRAAGGNRHVQASLMESAITLLGFHGIAWLELGIQPRRDGSALWNLVPYQAFKCSDAYIMTGALNDGSWRRLCDAVDRPDLRDNPDYETVAKRLNHRQFLVQTFSDIFAARPSSEWTSKLEAAGVPVCPIHSLEQILTHPQVLANGMVIETASVTGPDRPADKLLGLPFKLGENSAPSTLPPPQLGEHTEVILRDWLGIGDDGVRALRVQGAFATLSENAR